MDPIFRACEQLTYLEIQKESLFDTLVALRRALWGMSDERRGTLKIKLVTGECVRSRDEHCLTPLVDIVGFLSFRKLDHWMVVLPTYSEYFGIDSMDLQQEIRDRNLNVQMYEDDEGFLCENDSGVLMLQSCIVLSNTGCNID